MAAGNYAEFIPNFYLAGEVGEVGKADKVDKGIGDIGTLVPSGNSSASHSISEPMRLSLALVSACTPPGALGASDGCSILKFRWLNNRRVRRSMRLARNLITARLLSVVSNIWVNSSSSRRNI